MELPPPHSAGRVSPGSGRRPSLPPRVGAQATQQSQRARVRQLGLRAAVAAAVGATFISVNPFPSPSSAAAPATKRKSGLPMWEELWTKNEIKFHISGVNADLMKYHKQFLGASLRPMRVLVPLCGKTNDMEYLARVKGVEAVVGVEAIPKAIEDFAAEHAALGVAKMPAKRGGYAAWAGGKLLLLVGDIFNLRSAREAPFTHCWDRGALVALEPRERKKYVDTIMASMAPGARVLLVAVERVSGTPEALARGPPFHLSAEEIRKLYGPRCAVQRLGSIDITGESPRWKASGIKQILTVAYLITRAPVEE